MPRCCEREKARLLPSPSRLAWSPRSFEANPLDFVSPLPSMSTSDNKIHFPFLRHELVVESRIQWSRRSRRHNLTCVSPTNLKSIFMDITAKELVRFGLEEVWGSSIELVVESNCFKWPFRGRLVLSDDRPWPGWTSDRGKLYSLEIARLDSRSSLVSFFLLLCAIEILHACWLFKGIGCNLPCCWDRCKVGPCKSIRIRYAGETRSQMGNDRRAGHKGARIHRILTRRGQNRFFRSFARVGCFASKTRSERRRSRTLYRSTRVISQRSFSFFLLLRDEFFL